VEGQEKVLKGSKLKVDGVKKLYISEASDNPCMGADIQYVGM
jgi:hypothetical protein